MAMISYFGFTNEYAFSIVEKKKDCKWYSGRILFLCCCCGARWQRRDHLRGQTIDLYLPNLWLIRSFLAGVVIFLWSKLFFILALELAGSCSAFSDPKSRKKHLREEVLFVFIMTHKKR